MMPTPALFVSKRKLKKQRPESQKIVLGSTLSKDGFCCSKTKHDRRMVPRPKLLVSKMRLQKQTTIQKNSWVWLPVKMIPVTWKLSMIEE
jgi:hypothetical protein